MEELHQLNAAKSERLQHLEGAEVVYAENERLQTQLQEAEEKIKDLDAALTLHQKRQAEVKLATGIIKVGLMVLYPPLLINLDLT